MTTAFGILAVVALILANGYFVAQEFSYVAVRRGPIEELAAGGDRRAQRAVAVLKRLSFMLSGAQLGITATSLVVGYIAEPTLGRALQPVVRLFGVPEEASLGVGFTIGFIMATGAQMVFGELAPKNLAIAKPQPLALSLANSTWLYLRAARPVIALFDNAANGLLRLVGIEPVEEIEGGVHPEELELIIEESGRGGHLPHPQAALLSRVLEFHNLDAADVMVPRPRVTSIPATATCDELRRLARECGHSRFPVTGEGLDEVAGVVQVKDVLRVPVTGRGTTVVRQLMSPALAVPESAAVGPLLRDLRAAQTQLAVVVDEHGGTAGIVTLEDIVEELVGDIQDEYDVAEPAMQSLPDGTYVVPGSWRLDEAERDTGIALPAGDYDTLSGLVMERLGRLPHEGDTVQLDTALLRVQSLHGLAVGRVHVEPRRQEEPDPHGPENEEAAP